MTVARRPVTASLRALLVEATGRPCGLGELPRRPGGSDPEPPPYSVLYPLGGLTSGPPLGDADADARLIYQVTCVAGSVEQAEWLADRARDGVLGRRSGAWVRQLAPAGVVVMGRSLESDLGCDMAGGIVSYVMRFALDVTPG